MSIRNISISLVCFALVGCGSPTDTPTAAPDTGTAEDSGSDSESAGDAASDTGSVVADAATNVKLEIQSATYKNSTAAGGGFVYAVVFSLVNTSSFAVTSLDAMVFDFGGGQTVHLTKPACGGTFPVAPGAKRTIDTQVVVSTSGSMTNFSFICGSSQRFGGASGNAPPIATFSDAIAITVAGTTESGTFSGSGTATPR